MEEKRPDEMEMAAQENAQRKEKKKSQIVMFKYKLFNLRYDQNGNR